MNETKRYSPEVRERAVRLGLEHQIEYSSQWAELLAISAAPESRSRSPSIHLVGPDLKAF